MQCRQAEAGVIEGVVIENQSRGRQGIRCRSSWNQ